MNDDDHHKEVYAHFGLAVYQAQVLETGLANALVFLDFIPKSLTQLKTKADWSEKYDAFEGLQNAKTMGNLIKSLKKITTIPDDLEKQLLSALEQRKFLVHHYFREKILSFLTEDGRNEMIADFEGYREAFTRADKMVDALVEPLFEKYGFTPELQAKIRAEMEDEFRAKNE